MKIFSWNVNGLRSIINKGNFAEFFAEFQPDILCVQETKARQEQIVLPSEIAKNYDAFYNSAERKGYSGVAIFVKKTIASPQNIFYNLPGRLSNRYDFDDAEFGNPNLEGRLITLDFGAFFLANVYVPNAKDHNTRLAARSTKWDPAFRDYLAELRAQKPTIFCGDMNVAHREIDLANPKQNVKNHGFTIEERTGFSRILEAGFVDSFREKHPERVAAYTWWSHFAHAREHNRGWRIDYFGVDERLREKITKAEILPEILGSDHCPIELEIAFDAKEKSQK